MGKKSYSYSIDWEKHRNTDGSIDLIKAFTSFYVTRAVENYMAALDFLRMSMDLRPIVSRQVAAVAISYAVAIAGGALD